jgi:hypothetical protein
MYRTLHDGYHCAFATFNANFYRFFLFLAVSFCFFLSSSTFRQRRFDGETRDRFYYSLKRKCTLSFGAVMCGKHRHQQPICPI